MTPTYRTLFLVLFLSLSLATLSSRSALAQASVSPASATIRFSAVVQHVKGLVQRIDSKSARTPLETRSVLYDGERVHVASGANLKMITRHECVVVLYGESTALAPDAEKPWRIHSAALRWICPSGVAESLNVNGTLITVGSSNSPSTSEVLLDGSKLLLLTGQAHVEGMNGELISQIVFEKHGKLWSQADSQPDTYDLWEQNERRNPPHESFKLPYKERPVDSRWILTPITGRGAVWYDNHDLNEKGLNQNGLRVQKQQRHGEGAWIFALSLGDLQDKQSDSFNSAFTGVSNEDFLLALEAGYRFHHDRWWSPFFRLGLGQMQAQVNISRPDLGYYTNYRYTFYQVTAAYGVDALYSPWRWLGLYAAAEVDASQSLFRGDRENKNNGTPSGIAPPEGAEPWRLTSLAGQITFGLSIQY